MRLHIDKGGTDHERINLVALIALFFIVASAIFYLGQSFVVPSQPAGFFGPISNF
jgi:phage shock protein PspC (stress-responsive transcriptional regulator)